MSLDTGSLVSHYRIVRRLGAGGMGEVFLAQDLQLDRQVAIKFLKAPGDERAQKRLVQEARAAASLDHPFICAVYEVGSDPAEGDFIVMQFVEGEPLSVRLQRQRLPPKDTIALCRRIAEALKAAHAQGIIHRDLKPQNVIVTPSGEPKLLDFGIAKRILTAQAAAEADTTSQVTNPDTQVGTPAYMSPEQVRSHPADFRSDLFAFGCVLYECLTGRRAFNGPTTPDVLGQVLHVDPPPPSSIVPELGTMYDPICARLLKKDPRERFQSADEVLGALYALSTAASPSATTATAVRKTSTLTVSLPATKKGRIATAVALVLVIAGAFAVYRWARTVDLAAPPANAKEWYDRGVEALRQGTYAAARAALKEAVRISESFVEARWRLAEAESELDDEEAATRELAQATLYFDKSRLPKATRLRMDGITAAVLRQYDKAVESYRKLAAPNSNDEGAWIDIGRAEDGRGNTKLAREAYRTALTKKADYAPAHVRLGASPGMSLDEAVKEFDEAIRIYEAATNPEGEAEALIRKGIALNTAQRFSLAREALQHAITLTAQEKYRSQQLRARFELASVTTKEGHYGDAADDARKAVEEAKGLHLYTTAAGGLIDLAGALGLARNYDEAERELLSAIDLATQYHAKRTEMRARLQRASMRISMQQPEEAIKLTSEVLDYFSAGRYPRNEAQGRQTLFYAHSALGDYDSAKADIADILKIADSIDDDALRTTALDLSRNQLVGLGQLPEALASLEKIEQIHRRTNNQLALSYDLTDRAELLIELGRGNETDTIFADIAAGAANGIQAFADRAQRIAYLRALRATIDHRFDDALKFSQEAIDTEGTKTNVRVASILREYALATKGRSVAPSSQLTQWIRESSTTIARGENGYWVALTLLARSETALASTVLSEVLSEPAVAKDLELRWRLAAVALAAVNAKPGAAENSRLPSLSEDLRQLTTQFGSGATSYFARPDLKGLINSFEQAATMPAKGRGKQGGL